MKTNFRKMTEKFELDKDHLKANGLPVLKEVELVSVVEGVHEPIGHDHRCGARRIEDELRKTFFSISLMSMVRILCREKCARCQMSCGLEWFKVTIDRFLPADEKCGRHLCSTLGYQYIGINSSSVMMDVNLIQLLFEQPM